MTTKTTTKTTPRQWLNASTLENTVLPLRDALMPVLNATIEYLGGKITANGGTADSIQGDALQVNLSMGNHGNGNSFLTIRMVDDDKRLYGAVPFGVNPAAEEYVAAAKGKDNLKLTMLLMVKAIELFRAANKRRSRGANGNYNADCNADLRRLELKSKSGVNVTPLSVPQGHKRAIAERIAEDYAENLKAIVKAAPPIKTDETPPISAAEVDGNGGTKKRIKLMCIADCILSTTGLSCTAEDLHNINDKLKCADHPEQVITAQKPEESN